MQHPQKEPAGGLWGILNEEVNECDYDEYLSGDDTRSLPSDDDRGEENIDSDDDDDNDSKGLTLKEMIKFICALLAGAITRIRSKMV